MDKIFLSASVERQTKNSISTFGFLEYDSSVTYSSLRYNCTVKDSLLVSYDEERTFVLRKTSSKGTIFGGTGAKKIESYLAKGTLYL